MPMTSDQICKPRALACEENSVHDMLQRSAGRLYSVRDASITGNNETKQVSVFQLTGSVEVLNQGAEIKTVTTLTNCTAVHADLWDGTNSVKLTSDTPGAILSGAPVGTFFSKRALASDPYVVSLADECRLVEIDKKRAQPFIITQKNGADTFIRFCFTTTDTPMLFTADIFFEWRPLNGGFIEVVTP
jgi:hypothetical protein